MVVDLPSDYPRVVEEVLAAHPFVVGAVVDRDADTGRVHAVVCIDRRAAVSLDALLRHAAAHVRDEWMPTEVSFVSSPAVLHVDPRHDADARPTRRGDRPFHDLPEGPGSH